MHLKDEQLVCIEFPDDAVRRAWVVDGTEVGLDVLTSAPEFEATDASVGYVRVRVEYLGEVVVPVSSLRLLVVPGEIEGELEARAHELDAEIRRLESGGFASESMELALERARAREAEVAGLAARLVRILDR